MIELIIGILTAVAIILIGYYVIDSTIRLKLTRAIELLSDELVKATNEASENGKKITKREAVSIIKSVLKELI